MGTLEVRYGDFNAAGKALVKEGSTTVYSGTFVVPGDADTVLQYKFWKMNATTTTPFERVDVPRNNEYLNRTYTLGANGVAVTISPTPYFNSDEGVGPELTLTGASTINLKVGDNYTELGATANDAVEGTVTATPSGAVDTNSAGTYTVTYNASDANGNAGMAVARSVVVAAVGSTFAGAYPSKTLTEIAPNGLTYLANYAFGGNETTPATLPVQDTSDPTKLRLVVIYRTDDATLPLNALGGETTADLAGVWSASGVSVEDSTDSSPAPANTVRKVISVDRGSDPKKFLRATVTK